MLSAGDAIPDATVWIGPHESTSLEALTAEGPILLVFYLYDFSAT